eukprot:7173827-Lingulodinium_polyedra.AAC.1
MFYPAGRADLPSVASYAQWEASEGADFCLCQSDLVNVSTTCGWLQACSISLCRQQSRPAVRGCGSCTASERARA